MTRRVSLSLEALETRLTPATIKAAAVIAPPAHHNPVVSAARIVNQVLVQQTGGSGTVMKPCIGASLGGGGSSGSSGSGGIGGTTGDPAGP